MNRLTGRYPDGSVYIKACQGCDSDCIILNCPSITYDVPHTLAAYEDREESINPKQEIIQRAIEYYGPDLQLTVAIEELSELTKEICKYKRNPSDTPTASIAEEVADVSIMLEQICSILNISPMQVEQHKTFKLRRLQQRMDAEAIR